MHQNVLSGGLSQQRVVLWVHDYCLQVGQPDRRLQKCGNQQTISTETGARTLTIQNENVVGIGVLSFTCNFGKFSTDTSTTDSSACLIMNSIAPAPI
jgi:hypothetical protein